MPDWSVENMPAQAGRTALVTGGSSGLGYETALALAGAGARVIIAARNEANGAAAVAEIKALHPGAAVSYQKLDLADLGSVAQAAREVAETAPALDLLINNAGIMAIPTRHLSADGYEMQFAANHLGHFALTLQLLPNLLAATAPRVVSVSSLAHRSGQMHFDDLQLEHGYTPWTAYAQSKLANLLFAHELDARARRHGWKLMSNAAHPGFSITNLQSTGPRIGRRWPSPIQIVVKLLAPFLAHPAAQGALPTLFAATAPEAEGGVLYGPNGFYEMKGSPAPSYMAPQGLDVEAGRRLWAVSEQLTHQPLPELAA
jgi:NAD(P)-dependent dehydrogenase (short-subunit alcohol dehydrogenase family)